MGFGSGKRVDAKIYLEGRLVENSFRHAVISGGINGPAIAEIHLVPTDAIRNILPRTHVSLFTTDPWADPAPEEDPFKLVFDGQVIGKGFTKGAGERAFVIHCKDVSNNWEGPKKWWFDLGQQSGQATTTVLRLKTNNNHQGGVTPELAVAGIPTQSYMLRKIFKKGNTADDMMAAIISVLDDVGIINPFYHLVRNRYRITDRVLAKPAGETKKLLQIDQLIQFIDGYIGKTSAEKSLLAMVMELLEMIYHEYVALPVPSLVKARPPLRDKYGNPFTDSKGLLREGNVEEEVIGQFIFKPDVYTLSPPSCNVLYPNQYDKVEFVNNVLAETTRLVVRPMLPQKMAGEIVGATSQILRPTDLETYFDVVTEEGHPRSSIRTRTKDAKLSDASLSPQAPMFTDFDYFTNEERIGGTVYNIIPMAPAASLFVIQKGTKEKDAYKGGSTGYMQNIASYEYYKEKFAHRTMTTEGPYNPRVVPGFPMLLVDDSDANLNVIAHLGQFQHIISATGSASTTYGLTHSRLVNEPDYNRPKLKASANNETGGISLDVVLGDDGKPDFASMFAGRNKPPIPKWFSDDWKTLSGLDKTYTDLLGVGVHTTENALFESARATGTKTKDSTTGDNAVPVSMDTITFEKAVDFLADEFRKARARGDEFKYVSAMTARPLVDRDMAFKFIGAVDTDAIDRKTNKETSLGAGAPRRRLVYQGVAAVTFPSGVDRTFSFAQADTRININKDADQFPNRDAPEHDLGHPIYEGRPAPFNFEYRVFLESVTLATKNTLLPTTLEGQAKQIQQLLDRLFDGDLAQTPENRAPTDVDSDAPTGEIVQRRTPVLAVPLSEHDIITLRRAVIDAYIKELRDRGQRG
jgi:hypothetical protein